MPYNSLTPAFHGPAKTEPGTEAMSPTEQWLPSCEFQTLKVFCARHLNIMRRVERYGPGPSSAYAGSSSLVSVLTLENPFGRSLCIEDGICKINTGTLANTYQGLGYSWHPSVMAYVSVHGNVLRKFPDPSIVSSVKSSFSAWL